MSLLRPLCSPMRLSTSALRPSTRASSVLLSPRFYIPFSPRATTISSQVTCKAHHYSNTAVPNVSSKTTSTKLAAQSKAQELAKNLSKRQTETKPPSKVLIYHAGTGRITFLAMFKVTSLFIGAFFCFAVLPAYISEGRFELESLGVALCGIIPILLITYTTAPFVTHIHIHLPQSIPSLKTFITSLPPTTPLTLTTMSFIGKPRYSQLQASHLRPQRSRLGLVNYVRDHVDVEEAASRKWYNLRPVHKFYVQDDAALKTARKNSERKGGKNPVEWWIWDAVREKIAKRAAATAKS